GYVRFHPERCCECGKPCSYAVRIGGFGYCSVEHWQDAYAKYVDKRYALDKDPWEVDPEAKKLFKEMENFACAPIEDLINNPDGFREREASTDKKLGEACEAWWAIQAQKIEKAKAELHDRVLAEWEHYEREETKKREAEEEKMRLKREAEEEKVRLKREAEEAKEQESQRKLDEAEAERKQAELEYE